MLSHTSQSSSQTSCSHTCAAAPLCMVKGLLALCWSRSFRLLSCRTERYVRKQRGVALCGLPPFAHLEEEKKKKTFSHLSSGPASTHPATLLSSLSNFICTTLSSLSIMILVYFVNTVKCILISLTCFDISDHNLDS